MLMVNSGLVKDVKLVIVITVLECFLWNFDKHKRHNRVVDFKTEKILFKHFSSSLQNFAYLLCFNQKSFSHSWTQTTQKLQLTTHVLMS